MTDAFSAIAIVILYLVSGRLLYGIRWPDGFMPVENDDDELERVRRIGRRRVQPVPQRDRRLLP